MSAARIGTAEAHTLILRLAAEGVMGISGMFGHASTLSIEAYMRDLAAHKAAKASMRRGAAAWLATLASLRGGAGVAAAPPAAASPGCAACGAGPDEAGDPDGESCANCGRRS